MSPPTLLFALFLGALINLAGLWLIYSLLAYALIQLRWHGRGLIVAIVMILIAEMWWLIPADLVGVLFYFGNTIVTASAVVILYQRVKTIPRQLGDLAEMDGCGWLGRYWNIVLPCVRRDLLLIMLLVVAAMLLQVGIQFGIPFSSADYRDTFLTYFESLLNNAPRVAAWALASLILGVFPIATLFVAKRSPEDRTNHHMSSGLT